MENGSLLSEALQQMEQIRVAENDQLQLQRINEYDKNNDSDNTGFHGSNSSSSSSKAIILSLFYISKEHQCQDKSANILKEKRRQSLHLSLARAHSIIHNELLPRYRECYSHSWYTGGTSPNFGLHVHSSNSEPDLCVPHLRAIVNYGPFTIDIYHALAIIYLLTEDLYSEYGLEFACECWDIHEGQTLLIEGADYLPGWVEDKIGVNGMRHRVYIVRGDLVLIPPQFKDRSDWDLSRQAALQFLAECNHVKISSDENPKDECRSQNSDWTHPPRAKCFETDYECIYFYYH